MRATTGGSWSSRTGSSGRGRRWPTWRPTRHTTARCCGSSACDAPTGVPPLRGQTRLVSRPAPQGRGYAFSSSRCVPGPRRSTGPARNGSRVAETRWAGRVAHVLRPGVVRPGGARAGRLIMAVEAGVEQRAVGVDQVATGRRAEEDAVEIRVAHRVLVDGHRTLNRVRDIDAVSLGTGDRVELDVDVVRCEGCELGIAHGDTRERRVLDRVPGHQHAVC